MSFVGIFLSLIFITGTLLADQICPIEPGNPDFDATVETILQNPSLYNTMDADEFNALTPQERAQRLQEIRTKLSETGELRIFATQEPGGGFGMTVTRIEGLQFGAPMVSASQCPTLAQIKEKTQPPEPQPPAPHPPPEVQPLPQTLPEPRPAEEASAAPRRDTEPAPPAPPRAPETTPPADIDLGQAFDRAHRRGQEEGIQLAQVPVVRGADILLPPQRPAYSATNLLPPLDPTELYPTRKPALLLSPTPAGQGSSELFEKVANAESCLRAAGSTAFALVETQFFVRADLVVDCMSWVFGQSP